MSDTSNPRKRPRIFSQRGDGKRAVVFSATNYFNNDSNDDFLFNEPMAPPPPQPPSHQNSTIISSDSSINNHKNNLSNTTNSQKKISSSSHNSNSHYSSHLCNLAPKRPSHIPFSRSSSSAATYSNSSSSYGNSSGSSSSSSSRSNESRIRKAHQCHESGELTDFDANIEFYLDSIGNTNSIQARCLSVCGLAKEALSADFRMHLRAHEDMPRIIAALKDAPDDASLALSCATLMFIHNQDRMTLDIDPQALELMLRLLKSDPSDSTDDGKSGIAEKKINSKVMEDVEFLFKKMQSKGHGKYLNSSTLTASQLVTETLLNLTSKRAGDWFKEELRKLKGIDFLIDTITTALENEDLDSDDCQLNKINRCMNVLENVTFQNQKNQQYIVEYKQNCLIRSCNDLFSMCKRQILCSSNNDQTARFTCTLLSTLRVLNNLTSENEQASTAIANQNDLIKLLLDCATGLRTELLPEHKSDFMMIILCLLVNIVEFSPRARRSILFSTCEVDSESAIDILIADFYERIEAANQTENQADQLLDSHRNIPKLTEAMQDSIINQVINKSGKHMENCVIAACYALLFGCIIQDNQDYISKLARKLNEEPPNTFSQLIDVLQKLHDFAHLADIMTPTGVTRVKRILKILKDL